MCNTGYGVSFLGCLFWVNSLNKVLAFFVSYYLQYRCIFDRDISRVCCTSVWPCVLQPITTSITHWDLKWSWFWWRYFQMHFVEINFCIVFQFSLKFIFTGPVDNNSALLQMMAWCWTGDKPTPQPMVTLVIDELMHCVWLVLNELMFQFWLMKENISIWFISLWLLCILYHGAKYFFIEQTELNFFISACFCQNQGLGVRVRSVPLEGLTSPCKCLFASLNIYAISALLKFDTISWSSYTLNDLSKT